MTVATIDSDGASYCNGWVNDFCEEASPPAATAMKNFAALSGRLCSLPRRLLFGMHGQMPDCQRPVCKTAWKRTNVPVNNEKRRTKMDQTTPSPGLKTPSPGLQAIAKPKPVRRESAARAGAAIFAARLGKAALPGSGRERDRRLRPRSTTLRIDEFITVSTTRPWPASL
jgi:hypothetical protein